jgi:hypothetical protein
LEWKMKVDEFSDLERGRVRFWWNDQPHPARTDVP